ncbi:hypothetical protein [Pseudomonas farris]
MSLLNDTNPHVTVTFSLPPDFVAADDGERETVISVQTANSTPSIKVLDWHHPSIADGQWNFSFPHLYSNIGVKYQINIQMFHDRRALLLEQDYFVIVNRLPHRQTLHLSPIGLLYIEAQEPASFATEQAVTISLHESEQPEVQLVRVSHNEKTATSFYLKYDPDSVLPGKRYALTGIENRYHQRISVSPSQVELAPASYLSHSSRLQTFNQWLTRPLRLFTDALGKIR